MKVKRKRYTRGKSFYAAEEVLVGEIVRVEESLGATFITAKTRDGRELQCTPDDGASFSPGDRVRLTVDFHTVTECVAAPKESA
jgi:hypothetical protein